eukprot:scaffold75047_cov22-Tisochrysis_lutea.AAC.1
MACHAQRVSLQCAEKVWAPWGAQPLAPRQHHAVDECCQNGPIEFGDAGVQARPRSSTSHVSSE